MGLAGKLKAGGMTAPGGGPPTGGAPPQGGGAGYAPSAPPMSGGFQAPPAPPGYGGPPQQQQYGAPSGPKPAYPAAPGQPGGSNMNMQNGGRVGQQGGQFGQQGGQYGQQGGQYGQPGGQYGQPGGQFGQQGPQMGQQGNQFGQGGNQYGQQGNQFGQQWGNPYGSQGQYAQPASFGGQGGSQAAQFMAQQYGYPPAYSQGQGQYQAGYPQMSNQSLNQGQTGQTAGILQKLQNIVQVNQLHRFYQPQQLQALAQRIEQTVDFNGLAARWGMPKELATDLACLALYDTVILADDSSSMSFEENGERIEDLKIILSKVSEVATMFDQDGILIRFLNAQTKGDGIRNAQEAEGVLQQVRFQGLTPLAGAMQHNVLEPVVFNLAQQGQLQKPVLVITITDGEPSDSPRDAVLQVIANARRRLAPQYGPKALAFQFAQVGRDQRAQHFLEKLDKHPEVGDIIDCTSYYELEAEEFKRKGLDMTVEIWLVKMMVGAIDPSYDVEDEG